MSYWQSTLRNRLSRRRALATAGAGSAAMALLAACGGSDGGGGDAASGDKSGLLTEPVDTGDKAKRGGTLLLQVNGEVASLDVHQNNEPNPYFESVASRLIALQGGHLNFPTDEPIPDLAASWEFSPDLLQVTLKLRENARWHPVPPVNGRNVDVDDILYSHKRYETSGAKRSAMFNSVNPQAPMVSMTAPDARTIVVKFAYPIFYALDILAVQGYFMVPKEGADQSVLDLRRTMVGTGPYYLADYQTSIGATLKRNPYYWDKELPYLDEVRYPIIPEYATALAQFKSGSMHTFPVRQEDVLSTKQAVPQINLFKSGVSPAGERTIFGYQTPPFRDERVRQALSMSWDRDLWIDVFYNTDVFSQQGLPIERRWNTSFTATDADVANGNWLDPREAKFGPNAKYFKRDVAEAKKLLAAAGFPNGLDLPANYAVGSIYTAAHKKMEVLNGFEAEAGLRFTARTMDYNTQFIPQIRDAQGKFEGTSWKSGPSALSTSSVGRLAFDYAAASGASFYGFDAAGKGDATGDPQVESEIRKAQAELNAQKRQTIIHDLQHYLAKTQYAVRWPGGATSFSMAWPALQNFRVWTGSRDSHIVLLHWWLDQSLPPFKV